MIITIQEYKSFAKLGSLPSDDLLTEAIATAQSIIEAYLGYSVEEKDYEETYTGYKGSRLYLSALNSIVSELKLNGTILDPSEYSVNHGYILTFLNTVINPSDSITVKYKGGWITAPSAIKIVCRLITQAILANFNNQSNMDRANYGTHTITYQDNTKYYKYLCTLDPYKKLSL